MSKINDLVSRFGFHTTPFTCEIGIKEHFVHEIYQKPIEQLLGVINQRMSAALIAPAGTGKTAILRAIRNQLPETRYQVHYIKVTDLGKRDFCREIAMAVGAEPAGTYPALIRRMQDRFTTSMDMLGIRILLLIDEAHDIRPDVLGLLRILTNFEMDNRLVVSIVLAGQAPLKKMLQHPKLEDVAHRLATLRLLSRKESVLYIKHRCRIGGAAECPFDTSALETIYEIGRGNLRATDHLALKALETAHNQESDIVDSNHVIEARGMLWT